MVDGQFLGFCQLPLQLSSVSFLRNPGIAPEFSLSGPVPDPHRVADRLFCQHLHVPGVTTENLRIAFAGVATLFQVRLDFAGHTNLDLAREIAQGPCSCLARRRSRHADAVVIGGVVRQEGTMCPVGSGPCVDGNQDLIISHLRHISRHLDRIGSAFQLGEGSVDSCPVNLSRRSSLLPRGVGSTAATGPPREGKKRYVNHAH